MNKTWSVQGPVWSQSSTHLAWLEDQARKQFDFYLAAKNPSGGFYDLDVDRKPLTTGWPPAAEPQTTLFQTTRMVHAYGIGHLWGYPGAAEMVDHGIDHLWSAHRDSKYGGYYWANSANGALNDAKQIYGHAFVLLAASTAKMAGHPDADRLLSDVANVIDERFWEDGPGAAAEGFTADWSSGGDYRGANGNMHFVESLLAAYEATEDSEFLRKAKAVSERIILHSAKGNDWRIPEHYRSDWTIDFDYDQDVFRPYGATIGHSLEWSRLLLQLWIADGRKEEWQREAAIALFEQAQIDGWNTERGGYYFTVDWGGEPVDRDRYWWPCTEGIAAAHWMNEVVGGERFEEVYRRLWGWAQQHMIRDNGPWIHQLNNELQPVSNPWYGVPDIYHSLQATLVPTVAAGESLVASLARRTNVQEL